MNKELSMYKVKTTDDPCEHCGCTLFVFLKPVEEKVGKNKTTLLVSTWQKCIRCNQKRIKFTQKLYRYKEKTHSASKAEVEKAKVYQFIRKTG